LRKQIYITVGLPGSGKSSWLAMLGVNAISSDELRRLLADDVADQTIHAQVFETVRHLVRQRLIIGKSETYVDATHLTPPERLPYFALAREFDADVIALWFDVPVEECLKRNSSRGRQVPPQALRLMAQKLVAPAMEEGFSAIEIMWRGDAQQRGS
jgi:predicted kinase